MFLNSLEPAKEWAPNDIKLTPAPFAENTSENHVFNSFFNTVITEQAVVIIPDVVVPSLEHIACVKSILEHHPGKHLKFHGAFDFHIQPKIGWEFRSMKKKQ